MPYCSTSFRFSWASPVETTTGTGRSPPPSGSAARSGAILVQYPHCGLKKMSSTFLSRNSESLWRTPVRSGSSKSGAAMPIGRPPASRGFAPAPRRELLLDCLQPQQEAAILADELKPEPGSHANQQPRQNSSEHEGSHRRSPRLRTLEAAIARLAAKLWRFMRSLLVVCDRMERHRPRAQTERRGGAGPVRSLFGGKDLTGRSSRLLLRLRPGSRTRRRRWWRRRWRGWPSADRRTRPRPERGRGRRPGRARRCRRRSPRRRPG